VALVTGVSVGAEEPARRRASGRQGGAAESAVTGGFRDSVGGWSEKLNFAGQAPANELRQLAARGASGGSAW